MMISTRGRYALRVLLDLAIYGNEGYIPMKEVAERQDISLKYLEKIMPVLVKEKLIEGVHGKGGGYKLTKTPKEYVVGDIIRLTEGDLAPVSCLECKGNSCDRKEECLTLPMWNKLNTLVSEYFDNITLEDLLNKKI